MHNTKCAMWTTLKGTVLVVVDYILVAVPLSPPSVSTCWFLKQIVLKYSTVKTPTGIFQHLECEPKQILFISPWKENHKWQLQSTILVRLGKADLGKAISLQQQWETLQSAGWETTTLRRKGLPQRTASAKRMLRWATAHGFCCATCSVRQAIACRFTPLNPHYHPNRCYYYFYLTRKDSEV